MFSLRNLLRQLQQKDGTLVAHLTAGIIAALFFLVWMPGMFKPFALDETGSLWVASGGVAHIVERAIHFPQSILYCYLLWAVRSLFGTSPFVLRIPSLIAGVFTLAMLYRFGGRVLGFKHRFLLPLLWMLITPFFLPPMARPDSSDLPPTVLFCF